MQTSSKTYILVVFIVAECLQKYSVIGSKPDTLQSNHVAINEILQNTTNQLFRLLNLDLEITRSDSIQQLLEQYRSLVNISESSYKTLDEINENTRLKTFADNKTFHFGVDISQLIKEIVKEAFVKNNAPNDKLKNNNNMTSNIKLEENQTKMINVTKRDSKSMIKEFLHDVDVVVKEQLRQDQNGRRSFKVHKEKESKYWEPISEVQSKLLDQLFQTRRLYKGTTTQIKKYPFVASILIFQECTCGGAIISKDLVITAASCLQLAHNNRFFRENAQAISVRVGSDFCSRGGEDISVLEIYFHPLYNPQTLRNNLAIVRLSHRLVFTKSSSSRSKVKKIRYNQDSAMMPTDSEGVTVLGWGARSAGGEMSQRLGMTQLDIYSSAECMEIYSSNYMTEKNFCGGFHSKGAGACNVRFDDISFTKDAGDPGIVGGLLIGIVSYGPPRCGSPGAPTVFTKLGYYSDWIEEIMQLTPSLPLGKKIKERANTDLLQKAKLTKKSSLPPHKPNELTTQRMLYPIVRLLPEEIKTLPRSEEDTNEETEKSQEAADSLQETTVVDNEDNRKLFKKKSSTKLRRFQTVTVKDSKLTIDTDKEKDNNDKDEKESIEIDSDDESGEALSIPTDKDDIEIEFDDDKVKRSPTMLNIELKPSEEEKNKRILKLFYKLTGDIKVPLTLEQNDDKNIKYYSKMAEKMVKNGLLREYEITA